MCVLNQPDLMFSSRGHIPNPLFPSLLHQTCSAFEHKQFTFHMLTPPLQASSVQRPSLDGVDPHLNLRPQHTLKGNNMESTKGHLNDRCNPNRINQNVLSVHVGLQHVGENPRKAKEKLQTNKEERNME